MKCPNCRKNSIPFRKIWLKSGVGTYRCPDCGAASRVRKSPALFALSLLLGGLAGSAGLYFRSWLVLAIAFPAAAIIDAFIDFLFRRLEPGDKDAVFGSQSRN